MHFSKETSITSSHQGSLSVTITRCLFIARKDPRVSLDYIYHMNGERDETEMVHTWEILVSFNVHLQLFLPPLPLSTAQFPFSLSRFIGGQI